MCISPGTMQELQLFRGDTVHLKVRSLVPISAPHSTVLPDELEYMMLARGYYVSLQPVLVAGEKYQVTILLRRDTS